MICRLNKKLPQKFFLRQFFYILMLINSIGTMLIGAEGARLLWEYGAEETPQALKRRGGSPQRPRKAKYLERKSTSPILREYRLNRINQPIEKLF
ncbi:hypothetical protein ACE198_11890 [Neobacillus sp. KR4-4]|uniref:hypothetical protein n=1 Tax=Neobacillus sp. KR4-4 TaxID=3344872 RepID=UPI0035CBDC73